MKKVKFGILGLVLLSGVSSLSYAQNVTCAASVKDPNGICRSFFAPPSQADFLVDEASCTFPMSQAEYNNPNCFSNVIHTTPFILPF